MPTITKTAVKYSLGHTKENNINYFKQFLCDAHKVELGVTWGFDEQQADPYHHNFTTEEFLFRLNELVNK